MAERNAVKPRLCIGCEQSFPCTAKEIKQRYETCVGGLGHVTLPDCGLAPNVLTAIEGTQK